MPGGGQSGEGEGRMQWDWVRRVRDFAREMVPEERRRRPEAEEAVPDVFPEELLGENPNPHSCHSWKTGRYRGKEKGKKQRVRRQTAGGADAPADSVRRRRDGTGSCLCSSRPVSHSLPPGIQRSAGRCHHPEA